MCFFHPQSLNFDINEYLGEGDLLWRMLVAFAKLRKKLSSMSCVIALLLTRGKKDRSPEELVAYVHEYRDEYITAQSIQFRGGSSSYCGRNRRCSKWELPPPGWLKINCDAALDLQSGRVGVGVICRNDTGNVVECAALRKKLIDSVTTLEAMAIFDGLKLTLRMGATHVQIERVIHKL